MFARCDFAQSPAAKCRRVHMLGMRRSPRCCCCCFAERSLLLLRETSLQRIKQSSPVRVPDLEQSAATRLLWAAPHESHRSAPMMAPWPDEGEHGLTMESKIHTMPVVSNARSPQRRVAVQDPWCWCGKQLAHRFIGTHSPARVVGPKTTWGDRSFGPGADGQRYPRLEKQSVLRSFSHAMRSTTS